MSRVWLLPEAEKAKTRNAGAKPRSDQVKELEINAPPLEGALPWPQAIEAGIQSFRSLYKGKKIKITLLQTSGNEALLFVIMEDDDINVERYYITVDKTGAVAEIQRAS